MAHEIVCADCAEQLLNYGKGFVAPEERAVLEVHIAGCRKCFAELRSWEMITGAVSLCNRSSRPTVSFETSWEALLSRIPVSASVMYPEAPAVTHKRPFVKFAQVLTWQARLLHPAIWLVSALAIVFMSVYVSNLGSFGQQTQLLSIVLPLIVAMGIAFICDPHIALDAEMLTATPTSPRLILLCRGALIYGFDLVLGMAATLVLAHVLHEGEGLLAALWLGPTTLLASLSMFVSVWFGPPLALTASTGIWLMRIVQLESPFKFWGATDVLWSTSPLILIIAVVIVLFTAATMPTPRWRSTGAG